jgi:hypothetical protein
MRSPPEVGTSSITLLPHTVLHWSIVSREHWEHTSYVPPVKLKGLEEIIVEILSTEGNLKILFSDIYLIIRLNVSSQERNPFAEELVGKSYSA